MSWFQHRHWWRENTSVNVTNGGKQTGGMILEDCRCGAVRTIEYYPGTAPVVRIAEKPKETT